MSKNENNGLSPLEKLFAFLQLEGDEMDCLSYEEAEEEQAYMVLLGGVMVPDVAAAAGEAGELDDEESAALPADVRDLFAGGVMLPALGSFGSNHLVHSGALSGAAQGEEGVKEIPLRDFFSDAVMEEHLQWAEPTVRIVRESRDEKTVRYVAFAEVRRGAARRRGGGLRIVLAAPGGQTSEVTLSADCTAGVFMGCELPADWALVSPRLYLL